MAQMKGMESPRQLCTIINPCVSTFYKFLSDHSPLIRHFLRSHICLFSWKTVLGRHQVQEWKLPSTVLSPIVCVLQLHFPSSTPRSPSLHNSPTSCRTTNTSSTSPWAAAAALEQSSEFWRSSKVCYQLQILPPEVPRLMVFFLSTGVKSYDVNLESQTATISTEPTVSYDTVLAAIKKTGKTVNSGEADGQTMGV